MVKVKVNGSVRVWVRMGFKGYRLGLGSCA